MPDRLDAPDRPPRPRAGGCARWAAILLPVVLLARAILLVFQVRDEHRPHPAPAPPAWPAHAGEELRFDQAARPALERWRAGAGHDPLTVQLLRKDYLDAAPDSGCLLDPAAMTRHGGGTLTLRSRDAGGYWLADWSGNATMPALADLPAGTAATDPAQRRVEAAMLAAADCGGSARLSIGDDVAHLLVNLLGNRPPPPPDPHRPQRRLTINVDAPPA